MPSRTVTAAVALLLDQALFSELVLGMPLYPYQLAPLNAIADSILHNRGDEFLLVFSRQSGKNEAIAHLQVRLLNLLQRNGTTIVFAAIADAIGRGLRRLEDRLDNPWNRGKWRKKGRPTRRCLGHAAVAFLSSHPSASARGETAHHLLIIDELQDQDAAHIEATFTPMRAARNATAVYLGTARTSHDALWQKKQELERLTHTDGRQRVFLVTPDDIIPHNPAYRRFLDAQIRKHGRHHPIIASEYFLRPIDAAGGLFPPRRQALMRGRHPRQRSPLSLAESTPLSLPGREAGGEGPPPGLHVALIDVGGQDEGATDPVARLQNPGRDYTVCTIIDVRPGDPQPTYRALDVFTDHGSKHFQDHPGRPALSQRLLAYLHHWQIAHVVCDATGVGEGLANWLAARLGDTHVTHFKFTTVGKARLGSDFISIIETGRFHYWSHDPALDQRPGDPDPPLSDAWWFWQQAAHCAYDMPPGGAFDRDLRWGVPETTTVSPAGHPLKLHDDRLLSAALVAELDRLLRENHLTLGHAASAVIPAPDPLANLTF